MRVFGLIQRCQGHVKGTGHSVVLQCSVWGLNAFVSMRIFSCSNVFMWSSVPSLKTSAFELLSQLIAFITVQGCSM